MLSFEFKITAGEGFTNPYYFIDGVRVPEWVYKYRTRLCFRLDCFHTERLKNGRYSHTSCGYQDLPQ